MIDKSDCGWLKQGMFIDNVKSDESSPLEVSSCCRISDKLPSEFMPTDYDYVTPEQLIKNRSNPNYNYENLKHTACYRCFLEEQKQGVSLRTKSFDLFPNPQSTKLTALQVTFSNFCNLKCKYCSPKESTKWNEDVDISEGLFKVYQTSSETLVQEKKVIQLLESIDLSNLRDVGIFGGEPFMARYILDFLKLLARKTNPSKLKVQINTNGSIFPKQNIIEILNQFENVDLRLSIESIGNLCEYVRNELNWNLFEKNVEKWQNSGIVPRIHATHCVWTVNHVNSFYNWAADNQIEVIDSWTSTPGYSVIRNVLSQDQLQECYNIVSEVQNIKHRRYLQNLLKNGEDVDQSHLEQFRTFTKIFDQRTPHTLQKVNPQLYAWTHNQ